MIIQWNIFLLFIAFGSTDAALYNSYKSSGYSSRSRDFGTWIGYLKAYSHGIKGTVYAVDDRTIFIQNFHFDGVGPAAYFFAGNTVKPSPRGIVLPYPSEYVGREPPSLTAHNGTDVLLKLPKEKKLREFRWLTVWCARFTLNYAEVFLPTNLYVPQQRILPEFKRFAHGLRSGNITILDAKTFYIPDLYYDGFGPDAYFWVGNGSEPNIFGTKVPNEYGGLERLKEYTGQEIIIKLPSGLDVYNIDWLAMWCVRFRHNFGHIMIPKDLDVPPDLGQNQLRPRPANYTVQNSTDNVMDTSTKLSVKKKMLSNCITVLNDKVQVRWGMPKTNHVLVQLTADIRPDQYIAFGISGEKNRAAMIGSDVTVIYHDQKEMRYKAIDYYISSTGQCNGASGVCPDEILGGHNDVILVKAARFEHVVNVFYMKPIFTNDEVYDRQIPIGVKVPVIAAIGTMNSNYKPSMHGAADKTSDTIEIDFGTVNENSCNSDYTIWQRGVINGANVFHARLGPSQLPLEPDPSEAYEAYTNDRDKLGLVWYINKKMTPEIYVVRGKTYTFIVEGGRNPENRNKYHPLYITDNIYGGYEQISSYERRNQRIFAGVNYDSDGNPYPTTAGRYCEWQYIYADTTETDTLEEYCEEGKSAKFEWTVDPETPDVVYYQCYMHKNLGSMIHVQNPIFDVDDDVDSSATTTAIKNSRMIQLYVTIIFFLFLQ